MSTYVYSFEDTSVIFSHPNFETYSAYGTGIGSVQVSMANDITTHDVAADLSVVVSKSVKKNGTVTFDVLQGSDFNKYLSRLASYLENSAPSEFALARITIVNRSTGESYYCSGCSPQKRPDNQFQSQAQNRSSVWMCANISTQ